MVSPCGVVLTHILAQAGQGINPIDHRWTTMARATPHPFPPLQGARGSRKRQGVFQRKGGRTASRALQFVLTDSIGDETELADADQSGGQYVEQGAANELDRPKLI
jgi:hypothetical protein